MMKSEGCAGVAFFGESSVKTDSKALEWACEYLPVSQKYKLKIIHVNELNNADRPQQRPGSQYDYNDLEKQFKQKYPDYCKNELGDLQSTVLKYKVRDYIGGVTYEAENFESALELAIKEEKLDTLVLAWWVADDTKRPPIKSLQSEGCSIVLAKVDSRKLTFSTPPTEGSAATATATATAAAQSSSMAPALTGQPQRSNDKTSSSTPPSEEKTQCRRPTGSATDTTCTTPIAAAPPPPKGSPSAKTSKDTKKKSAEASSSNRGRTK